MAKIREDIAQWILDSGELMCYMYNYLKLQKCYYALLNPSLTLYSFTAK